MYDDDQEESERPLLPSMLDADDRAIHDLVLQVFTDAFETSVHAVDMMTTFIVRSPATSGKKICVKFRVDAEVDGSRQIRLSSLARCAPHHSGRKLLALMDELAARLNAKSIALFDASSIDVRGCWSVDLSTLHVLATGQTYYNQFGYVSESDAADSRHNRGLIDGATLSERIIELAGVHDLKGSLSREDLQSLTKTETLPVIFQTPWSSLLETPRQIFARILRVVAGMTPETTSTTAEEEGLTWLHMVLCLFCEVEAGVRNDRNVVKTFAAPEKSNRRLHGTKRTRDALLLSHRSEEAK